jgi:uncharacterized protein
MKKIFINIPVKNLDKATKFYISLGFKLNPLFTDSTDQKCVMWSESIYIMLQSESFSKTNKINEKNGTASFTIPVSSEQKVDDMIENVNKGGGQEIKPIVREPYMYLRSFKDLDGHLWGVMHLDMDAFRAIKKK